MMAIPLAVKLLSGAFLVTIAIVYWRAYGPTNFLWLSDIALALTGFSLILESPLLASMAAVGVLPLEIAWIVDFISGGRLLGLAAYMFDPRYSLFLRGLSLFHIAVPPALVFMLMTRGYDQRAFWWQLGLTWAALGASYAFTEPDKNINWVFGPGTEPQHTMPPLAYFALEMVLIPLVAIVPMHFLLSHFFPDAGVTGR